jgi:hypothetical protein
MGWTGELTMTTILETDRLRLREMAPADLDFVATMVADPEVTYYYERRYTRDEANAWRDRPLKRYAHDGHELWLVLKRGNRQRRRAGRPRDAGLRTGPMARDRLAPSAVLGQGLRNRGGNRHS